MTGPSTKKKNLLKDLPKRLPKALNGDYVIFTFTPNEDNISVTGTSCISDANYVLELPVEASDWRSFGFGQLKSLTIKHREILYSRILNGLEIDKKKEGNVVDLSWVWVIERKEKEFKKARVIQCFVRCYLSKCRRELLKLQRVSATSIQTKLRQRLAVNSVQTRRRQIHSVMVVAKNVRRWQAMRNYSNKLYWHKKLRVIQCAYRTHNAKKTLSQLKYAKKMHEIMCEQEKERAKAKAKEKALEYVRSQKNKQLIGNKAAVYEWEEKKLENIRLEKLRREQEERIERDKEERMQRMREEKILQHKMRIKKRNKKEKEKIREIKRQLKAQRLTAGAANLGDVGLLPKIAAAAGKPLGVNFYEPILIRKNIKHGKSGGGKEHHQYKRGWGTLPDVGVNLKAKEEEKIRIQKELQEYCGVEFGLDLKKSPSVFVTEHEKKNELYWKEEDNRTIKLGDGKRKRGKKKQLVMRAAKERTMNFLSNRERNVLNMIDASPMQQNSSGYQYVN